MSGQYTLSPEIIDALVNVGGLILPALISFGISKYTINKEIEKLKLTWNREDVISSDEEFAEMASAVSQFVYYNCETNRENAIIKIAAARSKETGELGVFLDDLYKNVQSDNRSEADALLTATIQEKRRIRGGS